LEIRPDSFLPRKLYAAYLQDLLDEAKITAQKKGILFTCIYDEANDVRLTEDGTIKVQFKKRISIHVDSLVLAIGTPPIRTFAFETKSLLANPQYTGNIWKPHLESLLKDRSRHKHGEGKSLVIIGSGLTAIDALFTLRDLDYQGRIQMISRNGSLPHVHTHEQLPPLPPFDVKKIPKSIPQLLHLFRNELKKSKTPKIEWRQLIDAQRSCTQDLWQSFPIKEKKRFLRHLFMLWNKHRHRMSPQSLEIVEACTKINGLTITTGYVQEVTPLPNGKLQIKYRTKKNRHAYVFIEADHVINCSGPDYLIAKHPDLLLQKLLQKKIVIPDELGLGLKLVKEQILEGQGKGRFYSIGSLLFGERFETTAVPELRQQADSIAKSILIRLRSHP